MSLNMILISIISSFNHKIEIIYLKAFLNIKLINQFPLFLDYVHTSRL